ncbi:hypothetical protein [Burkholderia cepacia]|uniref:hypothetical protein n=1 Tax=Burkholderia cepacia TaxID=292 RepID=UPI0017883628|nr:hypothetical protein [Burkholderia cepacia]
METKQNGVRVDLQLRCRGTPMRVKFSLQEDGNLRPQKYWLLKFWPSRSILLVLSAVF